MANITSALLTAEEWQSVYEPPTLSDSERAEYFTFSKSEIDTLYNFKSIDHAVYYAISLGFFKLKYTLINFAYRDVTLERQYVMQRYFSNKPSPRTFTNNKDTIVRIENKVLAVTGFTRFRGEVADKLIRTLQKQALYYPRQRQLCRALLQLMVKEHIAIPNVTTIQNCVTQIWNREQSRVVRFYYRYTSKLQRESVLSLLSKTDQNHRIVSIKKDMKEFNTESIHEELEKHSHLKVIFMIAKHVVPKLKIPDSTIEYYSQLINYYNGTRLKQLNPDIVQVYLLCYSHSRLQIVNDNLLEAFKKRTSNYTDENISKAEIDAAKYVDNLQAVRYKIHELIITIKNDTHKTHIQKSKLFRCMPESEMDDISKILTSEKLDKRFLFWKNIDSNERSISLNLRPLFMNLDISILNDDLLNDAVKFMRETIENTEPTSLPEHLISWIPKSDLCYIISNKKIIKNRFEFFLYQRLTHHIGTNKLTLKYSIKHKAVEDNLITLPTWKKEKKKILKSLPYPKLQLSSPHGLLDEKEQTLKVLYQKVNSDIENGRNDSVILKLNQRGEKTWRFKSLEKTSDPNDSLFLHFPKQSIADVMRFVDTKTDYSQPLEESILSRSNKTTFNKEISNAVVLANAIRMGSRNMSSVCNFNLNDLLKADNNNVRTETVVEALNIINRKAKELEIFAGYNIDGFNHLSLDGLKLGTRKQNIKARHSPKFLGNDTGVSSYNAIFNHFPITGKLIGSNEYEGNFTFEMVHHQSMHDFKIKRASTDRHGMNPFNFGYFDLTDMVYAPRIPKPHRETLWGFGKHSDYEGLIICPDKMINKNFIMDDWDNMQRTMVSMLTGIAIPSVLIGKMSPSKYRSKTKLAFTHYNHVVRSEFILKIINDEKYRIAIEYALNHGEAFNNLYRAVALLNGGKFRGQSEAEMILWDQCSRLVAAIILYYNAYILNHLYVNARSEAEKAVILGFSPAAWIHINMLGYYKFCGSENNRFLDEWLAKWNWQQALKVC